MKLNICIWGTRNVIKSLKNDTHNLEIESQEKDCTIAVFKHIFYFSIFVYLSINLIFFSCLTQKLAIFVNFQWICQTSNNVMGDVYLVLSTSILPRFLPSLYFRGNRKLMGMENTGPWTKIVSVGSPIELKYKVQKYKNRQIRSCLFTLLTEICFK